MSTGLLLSGGMDSIAIAWWKRPNWAVTIDYGQKPAQAEIAAAEQICRELGISHEVLTVDCSDLGSGDLVLQEPNSLAGASDWWPYRNQLLITLACMRAITRNVDTLYIGTVRSDRESHLDGTPEFVAHMDKLTSYQEGRLRVLAPAMDLATDELVRISKVPNHLLAWAHSCHKANIPCNNCRGCNKYLTTYAALGKEYWDA